MKGVKQTEIGLIPKDWEVKVIDQLTYRVGDGIHATPNYDESGSYYFINGNNLSKGKIFVNENTKKVSEDEFEIHKRDLSDSTILLSINGTIGNVAFYRNEPVLLGKSAAYLNVSPNAKKEYLFYQLQTEYVQEYFYNNLTGTTIKNLGLGAIRSTPIPLPPTLAEQQAIASALSDVDELIRSLDGLIQKKQAIKKGTMQQLLTGKKRLPGFNGEWEVVSIGELLEFKNGLNKAKEYFGQGTPIINYMDIFRHSGLMESNIKGKVTLNKSEIRRFDVQKGDVFFTRTSETVNEIGISSVLEENIGDGVFSGFILRGRPINNRLSLKFKRYCFRSEPVRKQIVAMATYTTRALTNGRQLSKVKLPVPPSDTEQKAIAQILSDMDRELQTLRQKREKYVQIKQGMMQELLTGRVRLV